jgi:isopenicillin N synthase-like dioxygenase
MALTDDLPPFPNDVPVAPLLTVSLRKLLGSPDGEEHERLFAAAKGLGFFYLDMRGTPVGEALIKEADTMFDLMTAFFDLPFEEKQRYDLANRGLYFGYKGIGQEFLDAAGTKDRNEQYNVSGRRENFHRWSPAED